MRKFRKKPVVIEAIQFTAKTRHEAAVWADATWYERFVFGEYETYVLEIKTLEGTMEATEGDWIIKGVQGEFYPCKEDIFNLTYEEVTE